MLDFVSDERAAGNQYAVAVGPQAGLDLCDQKNSCINKRSRTSVVQDLHLTLLSDFSTSISFSFFNFFNQAHRSFHMHGSRTIGLCYSLKCLAAGDIVRVRK
jgi:hypothetical protein